MFQYRLRLFVVVCVCLFFTPLVSRAAVVSQISPAGAPQGSTISVVITGSGFFPGVTTLRVSGSGVVVSSSEVTTSDRMTATLVLSAAPGTRNVFVQDANGLSNAIPFAIQPSR